MRVGRGKYEVCGLGFGFEDSVWAECLVGELWGNAEIRKWFRMFRYLLPDHPGKENTKLVFIRNRESPLFSWHILLICEHFEHDSKEDLGALHAAMHELELLFGGEAHIAYLSGVAEKLVVEILDPDSRKIPRKIREKIWEEEVKEVTNHDL